MVAFKFKITDKNNNVTYIDIKQNCHNKLDAWKAFIIRTCAKTLLEAVKVEIFEVEV